MNDKVKFMEQLSDELLSRLLYAKRKGLRYAFRPNVFSDREEFWRSGIMDDHPQIQFTDYTKNPIVWISFSSRCYLRTIT